MSEKELLKTALHEWHVSHKATMAEFAGFDMPIRYPAGELAEIKAVRTKAGLFDISHMGQIFVFGTAARDFLNYVVTRNLYPMKVGEAKYALACNEHGYPIDDLIIYLMSARADFSLDTNVYDEEMLVVVNASNVSRVYKWLRSLKLGFEDMLADWETLAIANRSEKYSLFALQGPMSETILAQITDFDKIPRKNYSCAKLEVAGHDTIVLRSGYTGEIGFEILCHNEDAENLWDALVEVGTQYGMLPCGLAARDVLRLEAGMPLYGHEISEAHDPISAGLGRYVSFQKEKFIGKDALLHVSKGEWVRPKLHAFVSEKGRIPRVGCEIFSTVESHDCIGYVTSGGFSPTLGKNIALGYLWAPHDIGAEVVFEIKGIRCLAVVVASPFYRRPKK